MAQHHSAPVPLPHIPRRAALGLGAVLAGLTGGAMVVGAVADPHPDAELLALLAEFDRLEGRSHALFRDIPDDDERTEAAQPIHDRQAILLDRICELRATTVEACQARAYTLAFWHTEALTADDYWDERMRVALLRDLLGPEAVARVKAAHARA